MFSCYEYSIQSYESKTCLMTEFASQLWWTKSWKSGTVTKVEIKREKKCA